MTSNGTRRIRRHIAIPDRKIDPRTLKDFRAGLIRARHAKRRIFCTRLRLHRRSMPADKYLHLSSRHLQLLRRHLQLLRRHLQLLRGPYR